MRKICVICEYGWIVLGNVAGGNDEYLLLTESAVVRSWSNGRGIGGIAKEEFKDEYILDEIGDVEINKDKILFVIPCEW